MHPLIGRTIDKYQVIEHVAGGASADVFKALQTGTERYVALKILRHTGSDALAQQTLDRFMQEARIIAQLEHPHILTVHEVGEAEGMQFLAMRFVSSGTLRDRLNLRRPFTLMDARRVAAEIGDALDYAHKHQVIHRDVKPENILVDVDARHLLADFGIAKLNDQKTRMTQEGLTVGTALYMSPEQARGQKIDGRSDLYSLAAVIFEMLVGEPPIIAANVPDLLRRKLEEPVRFPDTCVTSVPEPLRKAVLHALELDPRDRPLNARAWLGEIDRVLSTPRTQNGDAKQRAVAAGPSQNKRPAAVIRNRTRSGRSLFYPSAIIIGVACGAGFDRYAPEALAKFNLRSPLSSLPMSTASTSAAMEPPIVTLPDAEVPSYAIVLDASVASQSEYGVPMALQEHVTRPLAESLEGWRTAPIGDLRIPAMAGLGESEVRNCTEVIEADVVIVLGYELVSLSPNLLGRYQPIVRLTAHVVARGSCGPASMIGPFEGQGQPATDEARPGILSAIAACAGQLRDRIAERMTEAHADLHAAGRSFELEVFAKAGPDDLTGSVRTALESMPGVQSHSLRLVEIGSTQPPPATRRGTQSPPAIDNHVCFSFRFQGDPATLIPEITNRLSATLGSDPSTRAEFAGNRIRMFGSETSSR